MTKSLGEHAYELYAEAHSEDGSINPWLNVLPASKQAWHVMANQLAEKAINDWREAEQWCSSEDLNSETIRDGEFGAPQLTLYSDDGNKAYRYRLVETLTAATN